MSQQTAFDRRLDDGFSLRWFTPKVEVDLRGHATLASALVFKHGFRRAVEGRPWSVDFSFGDNGEINGFDVGRLQYFARTRLFEYGIASEEEIESAVREARESGDITFSFDCLYYVGWAPAQLDLGIEVKE